MPDFFMSFQAFPDWVNKFRTLWENIFGRVVKIEFRVCRETLSVSKKRERDHSEWPKSRFFAHLGDRFANGDKKTRNSHH